MPTSPPFQLQQTIEEAVLAFFRARGASISDHYIVETDAPFDAYALTVAIEAAVDDEINP